MNQVLEKQNCNSDPLLATDRAIILSFLDSTLLRSQRVGLRTGLLVLEINQFKRINVTYGYERTQTLLKLINNRLQEGLPNKDKVFYLGRDEFVIALVGLRVVDQMHLAINKIQQLIYPPFMLSDMSLRVKATIGSTVSPDTLVRSSRFLQEADAALLEAQDSLQDTMLYVDKDNDDEDAIPDLEMQSLLEGALERNELTVVYQPKTHLKTGNLEGVETLTRWNSHLLGSINPELLINAAEKSGLINKLTFWTIESAAKQYNLWKSQGLIIPVGVNLSTRVIGDPNLISKVQHALSIWNIPPKHLTLEVTETAFMLAPERSLVVLKELKNLGVRLSIDDFGTGYSSLAYIKDMPVNELKIDKSFVLQMKKCSSDQKIVKTISDLAKNFDLKVVAEGIEDVESYQLVMNLGCHTAQGYLLSKPLKPKHLEQWVRENAWYRPEMDSQ
jgi:diguanylate cyclase (GGDEF)-like protein